jgi:HTH-type transcriptional regulator, sugar sensing transcriptional regulator
VNKPIAQLQQLGFGKYESHAYATLLRRSPLNGYELAKLSGVPRADIYAVLRRLEERGAVVRLDTPDGILYSPVLPAELMQRLRKNFDETLDATQAALNELAGPIEHEQVWNTQGYSVMLEHARTLLDNSKRRVLLALWPSEAQALAENLTQAETRGVDVTTLCLENCPGNGCGYCRGHIYRYPVVPKQQTRWMVLVPDGSELLAAEIGADDEAHAVRTRQRLLVDLARWYIRHSIALAAVIQDLGERFEGLLHAETLSILEGLGPDGSGVGWLTHMRTLLGRQSTR